MKSIISYIAVLLEAGLAFASPYPEGRSNHPARQVGPPQASSCLFGYSAIPTAIPTGTPDTDVLGFCSDFLRPSRTITKTVLSTSLVTITRATTAKVTVTVTKSLTGPTVTGLCPTPSGNITCGVAAWGYATNNIYTGQPIAGLVCHQLCLENPNCASFQVMQNANDPSPQCNLYNVPASGNNIIPGSGSPYLFYDRNCPDLSPENCIFPTTTAAPKLAARDEAIGTPWFLTGFPSETLSEICSCIVTARLVGTTVIKTVSTATIATATVGQATTQFYTVTATA